MKRCSWFALALVAACGGSDPPAEAPINRHWKAYIMTGPDGGEAYRINCARNIGFCYEGAGESCPYGYGLVDSSDDSSISTDSEGRAIGYDNWAVARGSSRTSKRFYATIIVSCKHPPRPAPSAAPSATTAPAPQAASTAPNP